MAIKPIPEGYTTITPYLIVEDANALIDFAKQALDAVETYRMPGPGGGVRHAEMRIGDSMVMLADAMLPDNPSMPTMLYLYVPDVDSYYKRALAAGATSLSEPTDQFYGDRSAGVQDKFGNRWWLATHVEDVPPEEVAKRAQAMAQQSG